MTNLIKAIALTTALLFLLSACRQKCNTLYVVLDNVDGLSTESNVTVNGFKIGKVDHLELFNRKVLVTTVINKDVLIPRGSVFIINSVDLFGQKAISVTFDSTSTDFYTDKDTVLGQQQTALVNDSTTTKALQSFVDVLVRTIHDVGKPATKNR
ncbi:MAG: MlaD family protein [Chitinophagales bacterium]